MSKKRGSKKQKRKKKEKREEKKLEKVKEEIKEEPVKIELEPKKVEVKKEEPIIVLKERYGNLPDLKSSTPTGPPSQIPHENGCYAGGIFSFLHYMFDGTEIMKVSVKPTHNEIVVKIEILDKILKRRDTLELTIRKMPKDFFHISWDGGDSR